MMSDGKVQKLKLRVPNPSRRLENTEAMNKLVKPSVFETGEYQRNALRDLLKQLPPGHRRALVDDLISEIEAAEAKATDKKVKKHIREYENSLTTKE